MIFDKLCGLVERHLPQLRPMVEEAHIFEFNGELPGRNIDLGDFFLPFRTIATENEYMCTILRDYVENQVGRDKKRDFVDCFPLAFFHGRKEKAEAEAGFKQLYSTDFKDAYLITGGTIEQVFEPERRFRLGLALFGYCTKDRILKMYDTDEAMENDPHFAADLAGRDTMSDIKRAMLQIAVLNDPTQWVLESTPLKTRKTAKGRLLRSIDRPIFTIRDATEIRKRMGTTGSSDSKPGSGSKKLPHPRRAHKRVLRSEWYKERQGETIIVPATWVGPVESIYNGRRYKVRLDI